MDLIQDVWGGVNAQWRRWRETAVTTADTEVDIIPMLGHVAERMLVDRQDLLAELPNGGNICRLSDLIEKGRQLHPRATRCYVAQSAVKANGRLVNQQYHTCAIAAAWVGLVGPNLLEHFSYQQAAADLRRAVGYDIDDEPVVHPITHQPALLAKTMTLLLDDYGWSREDVALWLMGIGR